MKMKKLLVVALCSILAYGSMGTINASENSTKEENVYGILNMDGSIQDVYVVNVWQGGSFVDYGAYEEIHNLNSADKITYEDNKISVDTEANRYYYQGMLKEKQLPWKTQLTYTLDDQTIAGNELAGKSGNLKIKGSIQQNPDVKSDFYDGYALQITISLDSELCAGIKAENATIAEVGSKKQITYTVLPQTGIDFEITSTVKDFEMDAITINGIKMVMDINVDDEAIMGNIDELITAIQSLDGGAAELLTGAQNLKTGIEKYQASLKEFNDGMQTLKSGVDQVSGGVNEATVSLQTLIAQNGNLNNGAQQIQAAIFQSVNAQLQPMGIPTLTVDNYAAILTNNEALAPIKAQLDSTIQFVKGLSNYTNGVSAISGGMNSLNNGSVALVGAVDKLSVSSSQLYEASFIINEGTKSLLEGLANYKTGTNTLNNETSNLNEQVNEQVESITSKITGNNTPVRSFVSEENKNVKAVQFSMKTQAIKKVKEPIVIEEKVEEKSLWQKFIALF